MCVDWEWTIPCAFVLRTDRDEWVRREGRGALESGGDLFGHGEARRLVEHLSLCRVMRERAKACRWLGWVALGRQESEDWCERSRYLFFRGAHVLSLVLGEGESREKLSARLSMVAFEKKRDW